MRAIDTNVLVRLMTGDDKRQTAAAEAFVAEGAWVSIVVLAEATWVLTSVYEVGAHALLEALSMLLDHRSLTIQDADAVTAALKLFRSSPALGFSDCLIVELARKHGHTPVGTFDRRLTRASGATRL
jgi:predicted nucleic-acid-binding protein